MDILAHYAGPGSPDEQGRIRGASGELHEVGIVWVPRDQLDRLRPFGWRLCYAQYGSPAVQVKREHNHGGR